MAELGALYSILLLLCMTKTYMLQHVLPNADNFFLIVKIIGGYYLISSAISIWIIIKHQTILAIKLKVTNQLACYLVYFVHMYIC